MDKFKVYLCPNTDPLKIFHRINLLQLQET